MRTVSDGGNADASTAADVCLNPESSRSGSIISVKYAGGAGWSAAIVKNVILHIDGNTRDSIDADTADDPTVATSMDVDTHAGATVVENATFAVITESHGLQGFRCIMGMAYSGAAIGGVPTLVDQIQLNARGAERQQFSMTTCSLTEKGTLIFYGGGGSDGNSHATNKGENKEGSQMSTSRNWHRLAGRHSDSTSSKTFYSVIVTSIDVVDVAQPFDTVLVQDSQAPPPLPCSSYNSPALSFIDSGTTNLLLYVQKQLHSFYLPPSFPITGCPSVGHHSSRDVTDTRAFSG